MGAIMGIGNEYDVNMKCSDQMKTSTTQYLLVGIAPTSTNTDFMGYLANNGVALNDTMTARYAIGINQSYLSATSEIMRVRMFGIAKAKCAAAIVAGDFIKVYEGVSTTTFAGHIDAVAAGSCAAATMSVTSFHVVLGRALEDGVTNTVIQVFLNPQLYDTSFIS